MELTPSLFYNTYYVEYWYIADPKYSMYNTRYVKVRAKNKRHARKVLFKFCGLKWKQRRTMCRIRITKYKYLPWLEDDNYDGPNHFWDSQETIA